MGRVVHFEIHADNPERAASFYRSVFDWEIQKWDGPADYWLIETGSPETIGINGAIMQRMGPINGDSVIAYVCTIDVTSLDDSMKKAMEAGATIALDKMPVPGIGFLAYLKDTEGNIFGMMQTDATAH